MTLKSCIEKYENPQSSLTPYITPIWNSLKYEVRNGEVTETVDGAISVLRAIAAKLQSDSSQLDEYVNTVFRDTLDDLSEQTYVEQAGKMCLAVVSSGPRAFVSHSSKFLDSVKQNIQQAKSVTHTRDLLEVLHFLLEARQALTKVHNDDGELLSRDAATPFDSLFHKVYLPLWQKHITQAEGVNVGVLKAVTSGVAMLLVQEVALTGGKRSLLCSDELCSEITSLFTHRLLMPLTLSPKDAAAMAVDADIGLQEALSTIVSTYMDGFATVVASTKAAILSQNWKFTKQQQSIKRLWQITCQVSFIGCSKLPQGVALSSSAEKKYSPLHHFLTWTGALLQLTESLLTKQADPPVIRHMTAAIQHSICSFRDACGSSSKQVSLHADGDSPSDWAEEVRQAIAGADIPSDWLSLLSSQYFDIYDKVVLKFKDEGQIPASGSGDVYADFTRLSLFIVRHLYRRFTKESPTENGQTMLQVADGLFYTEGQLTAVIDQIAKIATLTIQTLDAPSQRFYNLSTEAFQLFRQREVAPPYWSVDRDSFGVLNLLTIGILSGLWPDAMVDLVSCNFT
jgi:DNA repair/transcription protein MET18/MMS19